MNQIDITEILRGCEPGRMQQCGYMSVIPLVSELVDDRFGSPLKVMASTSNYGTLIVDNPNDYPTILPFGAGYISKQHAQNHAAMKAVLLGKKGRKTITTAACIQESQGGTMAKGTHHMTILPYPIKEQALKVKDEQRYDKLWPAISKFNTSLGLQSMGHLEFYLEKFKDELNEFVAEFETVPNQVGAIVLINGEVVGIEKAPNYTYWAAVWTPLIRECYGSMALAYSKSKGSSTPAPKTRVPLKSVGINSIEDIAVALKSARIKEDTIVKDTIRNFITKKFHQEQEEKSGDLTVETLTGSQFKGQIVRDESAILYASLITDKNFKWNTAKEFRI